MLLCVISTWPEASADRVSGQRDVKAFPAIPAPVIATARVVESDNAAPIVMADMIMTAKVVKSLAAGPITAAQVFVTARVVKSLNANAIRL